MIRSSRTTTLSSPGDSARPCLGVSEAVNEMDSRDLTRGERGSSMVIVLLVLIPILAFGVAGLSTARFGLTLSKNYQTGAQAEQAAESGLVHAVRAINNTGGVTSFLTDVANTTSWSALIGTSALQMPGYSNITYSVNYVTNPAATASDMWITSSGQVSWQAQRTVNERLGLLPPSSCGAIDLPSTGISANFNGSTFSVDGNDYAIGATTPTSASAPTLGISTRTQNDANTVVSALNNQQQSNVTGTAVPNQVASVGPCSGPSDNRLRNSIVPMILNQPGFVSLSDANINGNVTLGTLSSPQISYSSGSTTISGNASGAGILVVDGDLTIEGDLNFSGLIMVLGTTHVTGVTGNATIYGALWTAGLSLTGGGSAAVRYSSPSLAMANSIPGVTQNLLPQKVTVLAWSQG